MTARSIAATILATIIVTLSASTGAFADVKRNCGPNLVQVGPGTRFDPTFKGTIKCQAPTLIDCGNDSSCPRGSTCLYDSKGASAGCKGAAGVGPRCSNGRRCPSGYLCGPPGRGCYDPNISYTCGIAICVKNARYVPGDRCYPCFARRGGT